MKIAFICTENLPSPAIKGGAIQVLVDGIVPLLSKKNEITIFSVADSTLPTFETKNNIHFIRVQYKYYIREVKRYLAKSQFDIIQVFNRPKALLHYKEVAPKSKFILSLHNDVMREEKISMDLGNKVVKACDHIFTISEFIKGKVINRFPEAQEKTTVAYSGVNIDEFSPLWASHIQPIRQHYRQKYGVENKKVILFAGRLCKSKGPHLLIQSMKNLLKIHPDTVLVIAGGKWFSDNSINHYVHYLHQLAKPLKDKVIFTRFIPAQEIPKFFLIADLFVCSSQWEEPLARVHYEAMAAGLPIITTNRGGNPEVITHMQNGYVIDNYNQLNAFVEAIDYYLSNPLEASEIAKNGRLLTEENFQYKHTVKRIEAAYQTLKEAETKLTQPSKFQ
ncbi:glycosyltransferase family 4 protein [Alkalihalobacterium chitinilyticum]|uniref:Glycosyltransferase family 4 protein n=1 Tax=Alkalihalobacterium chitinilyticum TaxID=2980103 RepID=A0ABT5VB25_9BACI|nr:glycosyltransferase family 4 protein [Alkalihalobacterium chitinilyticum]MDE5412668.1 glycosyltransferase family 4 protein [Alkalihalobacterium chitinilyticum]